MARLMSCVAKSKYSGNCLSILLKNAMPHSLLLCVHHPGHLQHIRSDDSDPLGSYSPQSTLRRRFSDKLLLEKHHRTSIHLPWLVYECPLVRSAA